MNVFVCTENPFGKVGGGETFYRKVVAASPQVNFYFYGDEKMNAKLPSNVSLISRKIGLKVNGVKYRKGTEEKRLPVFLELNAVERSALQTALTIVKSIQGKKIDHIHIPEYEIVGRFLKDTLKFYGASIPTSTFIHGALSQTLKFAEGADPQFLLELAKVEREQRQSSDQVFAFKFSNIRHFDQKTNLTLIEPTKILQGTDVKPQISSLRSGGVKPIMILAGRYEPVKGFEQILNLYPYLTSYFSGIEFWNNSNTVTDLQPLIELAKRRDIKLKFHRPALDKPFFGEFPNNGLLVIPSLFDSFNLMALEAVALGVPIVLSKEAGASEFFIEADALFEKYVFDPMNSVSVLNILKNASESYAELSSTTSQISIKLSKNNVKNLEVIDFGNVLNKDSDDGFEVEILQRFSPVRHFVDKFRPFPVIRMIKKTRSRIYKLMGRITRAREKFVPLSTRILVKDYLKWVKVNNNIFSHLPLIRMIQGLPIIYGRSHTFALLSDQAALRKDFQRALVYQLRLARDLNFSSETDSDISIDLAREANHPGILDMLTNSLPKNSHSEVMISEQNFNKKIVNRESLFTSLLENYAQKQPKLEIIVSSYAARKKLLLFLTQLSLQELVQKREVTIIFVDACSPELDYEYAFEIANKSSIGIKSFRMKDRISIQEAWNFGITRSTAPYLVFLGTDEAIFPSNLEGAISELEQDENLDWITYSSFVSTVDSKGRFESDKGVFDRSGFKPSLQYLDSSYINFVGGVLRKSVFDRFGYFDGAFKGAGDTEFKSRIMKHINVKCVGGAGGQFLDYPEERMTASMMAEIEDFIAWYSFRRGDELKNLSISHPDVIRETYSLALGYRKSYAKHKSTDIFMASRILELNPGYEFDFAHEVILARDLYLKIYSAKKWQELKVIFWTLKLSKVLKKIRKDDEWLGLSNLGAIRLDNSLEQHGWIWQ